MRLKYGENPHQEAVIEFSHTNDQLALGRFELNDKRLADYAEELPISSTLLTDLDRALDTLVRVRWAAEANAINRPLIAVVVKHGNPCGAAFGTDATQTFVDAHRGDSRAAFGGLMLTNFCVGPDEIDAAKQQSKNVVFAALASSAIAEGVSERLARKAGTTHLLTNGSLWHGYRINIARPSRYRYLRGARIAMQPSVFVPIFEEGLLATGAWEDARKDVADLALAWAIGSTSNSNTITLVKNGMVIGNGVGQQDRVSCCELAIKRTHDAHHDAKGAVAYSDSFFPFPDGINTLARAGIRAVFASSGSANDEKIIAAAQGRMHLFMISDKEGRGFCGH